MRKVLKTFTFPLKAARIQTQFANAVYFCVELKLTMIVYS